jgi:hypothetical protein
MTPIPDLLTVCSGRSRASGPSSFADCQSESLALASGATACAVTPDDRWSGQPESNRRRPAWEFPYDGLTSCHFLSGFIIYSLGLGSRSSRFVTPSHVIWAASWAAGARRRVTRLAQLRTPAVGSLTPRGPLPPPAAPAVCRSGQSTLHSRHPKNPLCGTIPGHGGLSDVLGKGCVAAAYVRNPEGGL